jgi:hypothetical protein
MTFQNIWTEMNIIWITVMQPGVLTLKSVKSDSASLQLCKPDFCVINRCKFLFTDTYHPNTLYCCVQNCFDETRRRPSKCHLFLWHYIYSIEKSKNWSSNSNYPWDFKYLDLVLKTISLLCLLEYRSGALVEVDWIVHYFESIFFLEL